MLFDVQAALAEILSAPVATPATFATQQPEIAPVSQVSRLSRSQAPENSSPPKVLPFAPPTEGVGMSPIPSRPDPEGFPYGLSPGGRPLTATGRVVSLDAWRSLSAWEKHGSRGRMWNGRTGRWEGADGGAA